MRFTTRLAFVFLALSSVAVADCVTPEGTIISRSASDDGTLRSFTGDVYPFGSVRGGLQLQMNPDGTYTGYFGLWSEKGTANGTIQGYFTSPYTYTERMTFTAGTVSFAGLYGYIDFTGSFNADGSATDPVTGGEVCVP